MRRSAKLRSRIKFQRRRVIGDDGIGNERSEWADLDGRFAAEIMPIKGSEELIAQRRQGIVDYEIIVRNCKAVREIVGSDRAVNLRTDEIYSLTPYVNPDQRDRYFIFRAQTGTPHE